MEKVEIEGTRELFEFIGAPQHNWAVTIIQGVDLTAADIDRALLKEPISSNGLSFNKLDLKKQFDHLLMLTDDIDAAVAFINRQAK